MAFMMFNKIHFSTILLTVSTCYFAQTNTNPLQNPTNEKVKDIEEVVLKTKAVKYKSKKENPAYAILKEVWKRKKNNALD